jgi:hypothetical protein
MSLWDMLSSLIVFWEYEFLEESIEEAFPHPCLKVLQEGVVVVNLFQKNSIINVLQGTLFGYLKDESWKASNLTC